MIIVMMMVAYSAVSDNCMDISIIAGQIMTARQSGVEMSQLFDATDRKTKSDALRAALKATIREAYKTRRYRSPEYQQRAVIDYKNAAYQACVELGD